MSFTKFNLSVEFNLWMFIFIGKMNWSKSLFYQILHNMPKLTKDLLF